MTKKTQSPVEPTKRKDLPQILELQLEESDKNTAIELMEQWRQIKVWQKEVEEKLDGDNGIKNKLTEIQISSNLEGLRHNQLVFVAQLRDGKITVNGAKFHQELLARGVTIDVIQEAQKAATKQGDPYWVRDLDELKK